MTKLPSPGVVVFHPDGSGAVFKITRGPSLRRLQRIVGGYIELVPHWVTFGPDRYACLAFCNEDGHRLGLAPNLIATRAWAIETGGRWPGDTLLGNVVVVFGSREFLQQWDDEAEP